MRMFAAIPILLICSACSGESEEAKFCEMALNFVKEIVHAEWSEGVRIEEVSRACEVLGKDAVRRVRGAYTTVISRKNGSPPVEYEVKIKKFGTDTYRLCSWRIPIDAPEETSSDC